METQPGGLSSPAAAEGEDEAWHLCRFQGALGASADGPSGPGKWKSREIGVWAARVRLVIVGG